MTESSNFVTKTSLEGLRELDVDGRLVLDDFEEIHAAIVRRQGEDAASLFAEPIITRGRNRASGSISWYTSLPGTARPMNELDQRDRAAVGKWLRHRLADVATLLDDPEIGPRLGAWFQIASSDDVWVVDGQPVLVNWGIVPADAASDAQARDRHFLATLGPYAGFAAAPAIGLSAWRLAGQRASADEGEGATSADGADASGPSGAGPAAAAASAGAAGAAGAALANDVVVVETRPWTRWLPLLIACILAFLVLLVLLIPGVLLYPAAEVRTALLDDSDAIALQREVNRSLAEQADRLRRELDGAACTADGTLSAPGDGAALPLLPPPRQLALPEPIPQPGGGAPAAPETGGAGDQAGDQADDQADDPTAAAPDAQGESPSGEDAPPASQGSDIATLQDLIDSSVVLIIAPSQSGEQLSTGSGFFVGGNKVVTNLHVVAEAGSIYVVNDFLGTPHEASVLAATPGFEIGAPDFALLEVSGLERVPPPIRTSREIDKLNDVIAPGFPGVILDTDTNYLQLLREGEGDPPEVAAESGTVTVVQEFPTGSRVIIHSADISPGNSGGPLLDGCGRAVGVNTFVNPDQDGTFRRLNYALHADEMIAFLNANAAEFSEDSGACEPRRSQAALPSAPPPPTEPAGEPDGAASGAGGEADDPAAPAQ